MSVKWHYVSLESVTERVISPSPIYDALNDHLLLTACCVVYCNILIAELYIQSFFFFFFTKDVNVDMCALFRWAKAGLLKMTALNAACVIL